MPEDGWQVHAMDKLHRTCTQGMKWYYEDGLTTIGVMPSECKS